MMSFQYLSDPAHGWIIVPVEDAAELGLNRGSFSNCSFFKDATFFVEEDCDAAILMAAHFRKYGSLPRFRDVNTDHYAACRHFPRCTGQPDWKAACAYLKDTRKTA